MPSRPKGITWHPASGKLEGINSNASISIQDCKHFDSKNHQVYNRGKWEMGNSCELIKAAVNWTFDNKDGRHNERLGSRSR